MKVLKSALWACAFLLSMLSTSVGYGMGLWYDGRTHEMPVRWFICGCCALMMLITSTLVLYLSGWSFDGLRRASTSASELGFILAGLGAAFGSFALLLAVHGPFAYQMAPKLGTETIVVAVVMAAISWVFPVAYVTAQRRLKKS